LSLFDGLRGVAEGVDGKYLFLTGGQKVL
jgi:hypothetical protein